MSHKLIILITYVWPHNLINTLNHYATKDNWFLVNIGQLFLGNRWGRCNFLGWCRQSMDIVSNGKYRTDSQHQKLSVNKRDLVALSITQLTLKGPFDYHYSHYWHFNCTINNCEMSLLRANNEEFTIHCKNLIGQKITGENVSFSSREPHPYASRSHWKSTVPIGSYDYSPELSKKTGLARTS